MKALTTVGKRLVLGAALMGAALPFALTVSTPPALAQGQSADALLAAIDANLTFDTRYSKAKMVVEKPGRIKEYELHSYGRGTDEAATEFIAPARDAGTRMLKKGGEMWMYLPSVEKVQKLSGHMLRQGLMGSDLSYEDMLQSSKWREMYSATIVGSETLEGRTCTVLELTAKQADVSYPKRKVWVDTASNTPLKQELYALSGTLLKVWAMRDPKPYGKRMFPSVWVVEDKLQQGTKTTLTFTEVQFGNAVDEEVFTMRWLER